jgi:FkbM family methyltransferase
MAQLLDSNGTPYQGFRMHTLERMVLKLRHHPRLSRIDWFWDRARPIYDTFVARYSEQGLSRCINGTDTLRLLPRFRQMAEQYEPEVWSHLMAEIRSGDTVADVGAYIGLYTVALAQRVGLAGKVIAFEPDPHNYKVLCEHIVLNQQADRVEVLQMAVGDREAEVPFAAERNEQSTVISHPDEATLIVPCVRLDRFLYDRRLDILKIDVEGYEQCVLEGALGLLQNDRHPRAIFIEAHPYVWPSIGANSDELLCLLKSCGYIVCDLHGQRVSHIENYGEIIARTEALPL